MTGLRDADLPRQSPTEPGSFEWVTEPDPEELVRTRASVRRWLATSSLDVTVQGDIELVVSEATAMALTLTLDRGPIEIRCRYTHSVAVIEVTRRSVASDDVVPWGATSSAVDALRETLLRRLTTRVAVATVANRTTIRCTITFDNPLG